MHTRRQPPLRDHRAGDHRARDHRRRGDHDRRVRAPSSSAASASSPSSASAWRRPCSSTPSSCAPCWCRPLMHLFGAANWWLPRAGRPAHAAPLGGADGRRPGSRNLRGSRRPAETSKRSRRRGSDDALRQAPEGHAMTAAVTTGPREGTPQAWTPRPPTQFHACANTTGRGRSPLWSLHSRTTPWSAGSTRDRGSISPPSPSSSRRSAARRSRARTVWKLGEFSAVALWLPPGAEPDGEAIVRVLTASVPPGQHADTFAVLDQMMASHPTYAHWYLPWLRASTRLRRGRGIGGRLLEHGLGTMDASHLPAYLEAPEPTKHPVLRAARVRGRWGGARRRCPPVAFLLRAAR